MIPTHFFPLDFHIVSIRMYNLLHMRLLIICTKASWHFVCDSVMKLSKWNVCGNGNHLFSRLNNLHAIVNVTQVENKRKPNEMNEKGWRIAQNSIRRREKNHQLHWNVYLILAFRCDVLVWLTGNSMNTHFPFA